MQSLAIKEELVKQAFKEHKFVEFNYVHKKTLEVTKGRVVEIASLANGDDFHISSIFGEDMKKHEPRRFDLAGMQEIKLIDFYNAEGVKK